MNTVERIPFADMVHGGIYRVRSRNLIVGVWSDAKQGIIGIREKFGDRYLFTETHWDEPANGTAHPIRLLGHVPEGVALQEHFFRCKGHDRPITYKWSIPFAPYRGQHVHVDDGTVVTEEDDRKVIHNQELFDLLLPYEAIVLEELRVEEEAWELEQASLKYKPLTREEHEKKERQEAAQAWAEEQRQAGRTYSEFRDEFIERFTGKKEA